MLDKLRNLKPTKAMIDAASAVFMAQAFADTIRPIVEGYQCAVLEKHQFHVAAKWIDLGSPDKVILDPKHSYLLDKEDSAIFYKELNEARIAAKLHVESEEYCPLLVAESLLRDAQHVLIEVMEPVAGIKLDDILQSSHCLENLRKYLDITMRLMAPFVNPEMLKDLAPTA